MTADMHNDLSEATPDGQGPADQRVYREASLFHDYINYPRAFGSPQQAPVAINVSDIQTVRFHWPVERLAVTGFEYALGWMKQFPNVSVSVYDGTLIVNIVYVEEFATPTTIRAIAEGFIRRLATVLGQ